MCGTAVTKKKIFWPKYTKVQETVNETQGKEVGNIRAKKVSCINGANTNLMRLVALVCSKHTYVMLTNWSDETRNRDTKKKSGIGIGVI